MGHDFGPRLKRLEASLFEVEHRATEFRVAGKSTPEVFAEIVADLFCFIEAVEPGTAAAFLEMSKQEPPAGESADDDTLLNVLCTIRLAERDNPGLPQRILDAIEGGAATITEETPLARWHSERRRDVQ